MKGRTRPFAAALCLAACLCACAEPAPSSVPAPSEVPEQEPDTVTQLLAESGADPRVCAFEQGYTLWQMEERTAYTAKELSGGTALLTRTESGMARYISLPQHRVTDVRPGDEPDQLEVFTDGRLLFADHEVRHFDGSSLVDVSAGAVMEEDYTALWPEGIYGVLTNRTEEERYLLSDWAVEGGRVSLFFTPTQELGWQGPAFYFYPKSGEYSDESVTARVLLSRVDVPNAAEFCTALEEVPGVEQAVLTPVESAAARGTLLELTLSQRDGWQLRFGLNEGRCTGRLEQLTLWCENPRRPVPAAGEENVFDTLDFMNEEQRQLYEEATKAAAWLFGMAGNLNYTGPNENPQPTDVPDPYYLYNVVYASNFLEKRVLPLFTKEFLLRTEFPQKFKQYNGDLLVDRSISRPMPYGTTIQVLEGCPDRYRLVKSDENVLEFMLIAHYDRDGWDGEDNEMEVFTIEYPIRIVNTDDGWRLDEFHTTVDG